MKISMIIVSILLVTFTSSIHQASAQYGAADKDIIKAYSSLWKGDRFPDGRPKVPDDILERMKKVEIEEAWSVLQQHGFTFQFEGDWNNLHPERTLVGRALTATFVPKRPDLNAITDSIGFSHGRGRQGGQNNWIIDQVSSQDVIVVNLFGKIINASFVGGNLSTAVKSKGGNGLVIDGGIRDLDQIFRINDFNLYIRGANPTGNSEITLDGINIPTRIGQATCMPGDVVLGKREGVIFIPAHLAEEVVKNSERIRLVDMFGFKRLEEGVYTAGEIDSRWSDKIEKDFTQWLRENSGNLPVPKNTIEEWVKEREKGK